jgi:predicted nuclease with RNAse H fold
MRSLGIDLTGSEKRASGVALLECHASTGAWNYSVIYTRRVKTDAEMISLIMNAGVDITSIDSPLSLPEDSTKIYRNCELELKRRGIGVYWCLLPSMKALTHRGIELADRIRRHDTWNIPNAHLVIESYPGAAQDILGVPRKNKGLDVLRAGLRTFGIEGNLEVSHDELDAVTAALVGIFYLRGDYEALGPLILPKGGT